MVPMGFGARYKMKPGDLIKVVSPHVGFATHAPARKVDGSHISGIEFGAVGLLIYKHPDNHFLHDHVRILVGETLYEISAKNVKVINP